MSSIRMNYKQRLRIYAVRFSRRCRAFTKREWRTLDLLCWEMLDHFNKLLGVRGRRVRAPASEMGNRWQPESDLIPEFVQEGGRPRLICLGALGARLFFDLEAFSRGPQSRVVFQDYKHPALSCKPMRLHA
jgi:hypothetical protein